MAGNTETIKWWPQRVKSIPQIIPVVLLGLICMTPAVYFPPPFDLRARYYDLLIVSHLFALREPGTPGTRSAGVRIWDWTHVWAVVVAQLLLIVGVPLFLFFWLDLQRYASNGVPEKVDAAQLIVASIVGAIAANIFLSSQLPRLAVPRVFCSFMAGSSINTYVERYRKIEHFIPGDHRWIHLRITNVGTIYYSGFTASCEIPDGWDVPFWVEEIPDQVPPRNAVNRTPTGGGLDPPTIGVYARGYRFLAEQHQIDFSPFSDPRDTGPGASAVFQVYLRAPDRAGNYRLRIKISANEAGGTAINDLTLRVHPNEKPDELET